MENLTHTFIGALLGSAGLSRKVPLGTTGLVIAANLPDIDGVASFRGNLYYLHFHRGFTHSITGSLVLALAFTGLLWLLNRRRKIPLSTSFLAILGRVTATLATHPALDFTNSYGWRPYLPFSSEWVYGDLVFIVDPYFWLILGGGLFLSRQTDRKSEIALWGALTIILTLLVMWGSLVQNLIPTTVLWVWFSAIALLCFLKTRRRTYGMAGYLGTMMGVLAYLLLLLMARSATEDLAYGHLAGAPRKFDLLPRPADPFTWDLFAVDGERIYRKEISIFKTGSPFRTLERNLQHQAVQAVLETCPGKIMSHFSRYEYFQVREGPQGVLVTIEDARFGLRGGSSWTALTLWLSRDLRTYHLDLPCPKCSVDRR